jgi:hypothetical protein
LEWKALEATSALDIVGTKAQFGKTLEKVSKLRIGQNNLENLLPHSAENSLKSHGLSQQLWLSKILGQAVHITMADHELNL